MSVMLNSSPPSAAYMRQWMGPVMVQTMACRLYGAEPLSKPILGYCQSDPKKQTAVIFFYQNTRLFIHENASENIVCEMAAILSGRRCVNSGYYILYMKFIHFWQVHKVRYHDYRKVSNIRRTLSQNLNASRLIF